MLPRTVAIDMMMAVVLENEGEEVVVVEVVMTAEQSSVGFKNSASLWRTAEEAPL